jgi:hypothetical protein
MAKLLSAKEFKKPWMIFDGCTTTLPPAPQASPKSFLSYLLPKVITKPQELEPVGWEVSWKPHYSP